MLSTQSTVLDGVSGQYHAELIYFLLICYHNLMTKPHEIIDTYLDGLPAWQRAYLTEFRDIIHEQAPDCEEAWKWSTPVFMVGGKMIFAMAAFKKHTKYNFILNGASLNDTDGLLNSGFDAKNSRSIDRLEGVEVDRDKLCRLVKESLDLAKSR